MKYISTDEKLIALDMVHPIWDHFFTIAPLIVIGTKENDSFNLAPKHMATPLGLQNYFGFVCTPQHTTYHNIKKEEAFTVSFPKPNQVVLASLASLPRCETEREEKYIAQKLPTFSAKTIEAPFLKDSYLYLECKLDKIVDGFGDHSLIAGKIIATYIDEDYLRVFEKDEQKMIYDAPMLAFLAHGRFAEVKETQAFPYPKDFKK